MNISISKHLNPTKTKSISSCLIPKERTVAEMVLPSIGLYLKNYDNSVPFFLSGGLSADNISEVLKLEGMNLHAVDVNSKFELEARCERY